jgi:hypothetical protein
MLPLRPTPVVSDFNNFHGKIIEIPIKKVMMRRRMIQSIGKLGGAVAFLAKMRGTPAGKSMALAGK